MSFFFYIPHLFMAEVFFGQRFSFRSPFMRMLSILILLVGLLMLGLGTYYFLKLLWVAQIFKGITGMCVPF